MSMTQGCFGGPQNSVEVGSCSGFGVVVRGSSQLSGEYNTKKHGSHSFDVLFEALQILCATYHTVDGRHPAPPVFNETL